jgi:hypothetical protein
MIRIYLLAVQTLGFSVGRSKITNGETQQQRVRPRSFPNYLFEPKIKQLQILGQLDSLRVK